MIKAPYIRLKRLFYAIKNYKFLKKSFNIKYPVYNALFGGIKGLKEEE